MLITFLKNTNYIKLLYEIVLYETIDYYKNKKLSLKNIIFTKLILF